MASVCILCGKNIGIASNILSHKYQEGIICNKCYAEIEKIVNLYGEDIEQLKLTDISAIYNTMDIIKPYIGKLEEISNEYSERIKEIEKEIKDNQKQIRKLKIEMVKDKTYTVGSIGSTVFNYDIKNFFSNMKFENNIKEYEARGMRHQAKMTREFLENRNKDRNEEIEDAIRIGSTEYSKGQKKLLEYKNAGLSKEKEIISSFILCEQFAYRVEKMPLFGTLVEENRLDSVKDKKILEYFLSLYKKVTNDSIYSQRIESRAKKIELAKWYKTYTKVLRSSEYEIFLNERKLSEYKMSYEIEEAEYRRSPNKNQKIFRDNDEYAVKKYEKKKIELQNKYKENLAQLKECPETIRLRDVLADIIDVDISEEIDIDLKVKQRNEKKIKEEQETVLNSNFEDTLKTDDPQSENDIEKTEQITNRIFKEKEERKEETKEEERTIDNDILKAEESNKNINSGKRPIIIGIRWIICVFIIFLSIGGFSFSLLSGVLCLLSGLIMMPYGFSNKRAKLSSGLQISISIFLFFMAILI